MGSPITLDITALTQEQVLSAVRGADIQVTPVERPNLIPETATSFRCAGHRTSFILSIFLAADGTPSSAWFTVDALGWTKWNWLARWISGWFTVGREIGLQRRAKAALCAIGATQTGGWIQ